MMVMTKARRLFVTVLAFGILTAGCAQVDEVAEVPKSNTSQQTKVTKPTSKNNNEPKKDLEISSQADDADVSAKSNKPDQSDSKDTTSAKDKKDPAKLPNYNISEPFDIAKPTLMGITIGDTLESVVARFGKASSESTMNDGQQLQILEYPGFSFGANELKSIIFIEVTTDQIAPGLNQFRVGQTVEEAQKALGPANSLNDYVMIYQFGDLLLKCDLDPNNQTVISIKLFSV